MSKNNYDTTREFYHGTWMKNLPNILENGIEPRQQTPQRPKCIHLSHAASNASNWGDGVVIAVRDIEGKLEKSMFGEGWVQYTETIPPQWISNIFIVKGSCASAVNKGKR